MLQTRKLDRNIFFGLALAATLVFLADGQTASGGRTLKTFWENRGKAETSEMQGSLATAHARKRSSAFGQA